MNFKTLDLQDFVTLTIKDYTEDFPEFSKLGKMALVIPISSAAAEKGFSCMKRVKTSLRNRLTEKKLKSLMMISVAGPILKDANEVLSNANKKFCRKKD